MVDLTIKLWVALSTPFFGLSIFKISRYLSIDKNSRDFEQEAASLLRLQSLFMDVNEKLSHALMKF